MITKDSVFPFSLKCVQELGLRLCLQEYPRFKSIEELKIPNPQSKPSDEQKPK